MCTESTASLLLLRSQKIASVGRTVQKGCHSSFPMRLTASRDWAQSIPLDKMDKFTGIDCKTKHRRLHTRLQNARKATGHKAGGSWSHPCQARRARRAASFFWRSIQRASFSGQSPVQASAKASGSALCRACNWINRALALESPDPRVVGPENPRQES